MNKAKKEDEEVKEEIEILAKATNLKQTETSIVEVEMKDETS